MGNKKLIHNTELQDEQLKDETETFNSFINVMVQIVEKYGKTVLQELDCGAVKKVPQQCSQCLPALARKNT